MGVMSEHDDNESFVSVLDQKQPWKDDSESIGCDHCGRKFTLFRRRHHCRQCGEIFCRKCCKLKVKGVAGYGDEPQRICVKCTEPRLITADNTRTSRSRSLSPLLDQHRRQVCILGHVAVGKSAIFQQYMESTSPDIHKPTVLTIQTKEVSVSGTDYSLTVIDADTERHQSLSLHWDSSSFPSCHSDSSASFQPPYLVGTDAFLLVYSIDDRSSFRAIQKIRERILESHFLGSPLTHGGGGGAATMMLVGNKNDLPEENRAVSTAEGKALAGHWQIPFMEVSAKEPEAVDGLFNELLQAIGERE